MVRDTLLLSMDGRSMYQILNQLRDEKGMTVLQIAHNQIKRYEDPSQEPHDRHEIKLHRKAADLIVEHSDAVFFLQLQNWNCASQR